MQTGFPVRLLTLLRCPTDAGDLRVVGEPSVETLADGVVSCTRCRGRYRIQDGILVLLSPKLLHPESAHEMRLRDAKNDSLRAGQEEWTSRLADITEVAPTLAALDARPGMTVLELGCGTGRYTFRFSGRADVVAVDFSMSGLLVARQKAESSAAIALVLADVTRPYVAAARFDRVLSTLHSNLPTRQQRMASLALVADAMKDSGRAVISMHHYSLRDVLLRHPPDGRYTDGGIYRRYMGRREARHEAAAYFEAVRFRYLAARVPLLRNHAALRLAARIPLVRSSVASLFLTIAEAPRRQPRLHAATPAGDPAGVRTDQLKGVSRTDVNGRGAIPAR